MPQEPSHPSTRNAGPAGERATELARAMLRSRGGMILLAALVGVLLATGLALFLVFGSQAGTASVAAQHFCDALVAHDYATAYADLSQSLQQEGTEEQFAASQRSLDVLRGAASGCTFSNTSVNGARATFILRVTRARSGTTAGTLRMTHETDSWKVAAYDANVI